MAIKDKKVSEVYGGRDISSLSDRPNEDGLSGAQLKARFDQLGKEVIPNYNDLIDELNDTVLPSKADRATTYTKTETNSLIAGVVAGQFPPFIASNIPVVPSSTLLSSNVQDALDEIDLELVNLIPQTITNIVNVVEKYNIDNTGANDVSISLITVFDVEKGKTIYFPNGIYKITIGDKGLSNYDGVIPVYSNTKIKMGENAKFLISDLSLVNRQNGVFIINGSSTDVRENIIFDGVNIEGSYFGDIAILPHPQGIYIKGDNGVDDTLVNKNILIKNCNFKNLASCVYVMQDCNNTQNRQSGYITIDSCTFDNIMGGFVISDGYGIIINNCKGHGCSSNPSLAYDAISNHCGIGTIISNNIFEDFGSNGNVINIRSYGSVGLGSNDVTVINNILRNCRGISISSPVDSIAGSDVYNISVKGNKLFDLIDSGIKIENLPAINYIRHITIDSNHIYGTKTKGIICAGAGANIEYIKIINNYIYAETGQGLSAYYIARSTIENNTFIIEVGTTTYNLSIVTSSSYSTISGNYVWIKSGDSYGADLLGSNNSIISNNIEGTTKITGLANANINGNKFTTLLVNDVNVNVFEARKGKSTIYNTIIPATGTWALGDRVINTSPSAGGYAGWVCVTAGTPGTWKGYGVIQA